LAPYDSKLHPVDKATVAASQLVVLVVRAVPIRPAILAFDQAFVAVHSKGYIDKLL
jgi:hypothetical protein